MGVAAIPPSAFYHDKSEARDLVRFAFCKDEETLREAIGRLRRLRVRGVASPKSQVPRVTCDVRLETRPDA